QAPRNRASSRFLGACDNHDRCWRRCNGPDPPYLGLAHRRDCDFRFLLDMEAACAAWSVVLAYPGSGWNDVGDFLEDCSAVAGTFAAAVASPIATRIFWATQCEHGCNPDGCTFAPAPWNPLCGRGQCYLYLSLPFPSPDDPPEPEDPCFDPDSELMAAMIEGDPLVAEALPATNYPLLRHDRRDGFRYRMEEWAVLSIQAASDGGIVAVEVVSASSPSYGDFQRRVLRESMDRATAGRGGEARDRLQPGRSVVLVVNQPPHAHDERWIPSPRARLDPAALPLPDTEEFDLLVPQRVAARMSRPSFSHWSEPARTSMSRGGRTGLQFSRAAG
ncbi:MAG TPA: hypothetical protein VHM02_03415, partial [Thermoanaerobaculia bacterium]|nr:hypothetical protein [Thermoanaerobaculia bacterium]